MSMVLDRGGPHGNARVSREIACCHADPAAAARRNGPGRGDGGAAGDSAASRGDSHPGTSGPGAPGTRSVRSAEARARDASETLTHVLEQPGPDVVRVEPQHEGVVLLVGETPIVELTQEDASAVGTNNLPLYAAAAAQRPSTRG